MDNTGAIWVKSGSDKRRVTAREEMQRMFQAAQLVHGDDVPVPGTSVSDIDLDYFRRFFGSVTSKTWKSRGSHLARCCPICGS